MTGSTLRVLFLGTGTSHGVPMIGCDCAVCRSQDPRDKRTRASVLVRTDSASILIDVSPDFRQQMLRHDIKHLDAILITHAHADHILGLDDVRAISALQQSHIPLYADADTIETIRRKYSYIFNDEDFRLGWGIPRIRLHEINSVQEVAGMEVTAVPIRHGDLTILGYRIRGLAYLTDCSGLPESSVPLLKDVDTLVMDALKPKPHPTHFSLPEALDAIRTLKPGRAFLTHISHRLPQSATDADLPENVHMAYDGLEIGVPHSPSHA